MSAIPVEHCPKVELIELPSKSVMTHDGHQVKLGSVTYFRLGVGPTATEYAVISNHAIKTIDGWKVAAIGPRGTPCWMTVTDLVKDKEGWWAFYKKRYAPTVQVEEKEEDVRRTDGSARTGQPKRKRGQG